MSLGQRLKEARKDAKLSQKQLASMVGISQGMISDLENDVYESTGKVADLASVLKVSGIWLSSGKGPKTIKGEASNVKTGPDFKGLCPLVSWIRAGELCDVFDPFQPGDADHWFQCPVKHGTYTYILEVVGDSMDSGDASGYRSGEHIYVDPEQEAVHGDDVVVRTPDGKATFKRLQITPEGSFLLALNPNWPNRIIQVAEGTVVCGKIIYSGKPRG